jgi:hypothetical protein
MTILNNIKATLILAVGLTVCLGTFYEGEAAQRMRLYRQQLLVQQAEKKAVRVANEKEASEKQAKEKEISARIAFEKEQAQKQIAQRKEDERKAILRQQKHVQPQSQQHQPPQTPQTMTLQEGKAFTSSLIGNVKEAAKLTNPYTVPHYQTDKPKEASLDNGTIGDVALAESRANSLSQHLISSAQDRPRFKIDPDTDPLFVKSNQVLKNPQKSLNEDITEVHGSEGTTEEIKTCEEGGDEYQQTCSKQLKVTLNITPASKKTVYSCPGHAKKERKGWSMHYSHWTEYCGNRNCTSTEADVPKVVEESDKWIDGCTNLEDLVDKGICRYINTSRSTQNETRMIQGEPITRDHFEEHYHYACFQPSQNSCAVLREQGCYQIKSVCHKTVGNNCVLWQQTYSCPSGKKSAKSYRASNKENPYYLSGDCADTSYEANNELLSAMSHLYVLREAQNNFKEFNVIFKGQHRWCTRNCLNFRDCCGSDQGWGVALHLSDCDKAEIELRTLRDKKLCVQVGTYCAERDKVFNSCLRKKTSFCCYGTKLARLIQHQGRAQLGIEFGSAEHPACEGLSPDQLSRIDFSKINFSEIFEEITNKMVSKDQGQSLAKVSTERLQDNMTLLTKPPANQQANEELNKLKEKGL